VSEANDRRKAFFPSSCALPVGLIRVVSNALCFGGVPLDSSGARQYGPSFLVAVIAFAVDQLISRPDVARVP
jgi:hypothetical protein